MRMGVVLVDPSRAGSQKGELAGSLIVKYVLLSKIIPGQ